MKTDLQLPSLNVAEDDISFQGIDIDTYQDDNLDNFMPPWYRILATFAIGTIVLLIFLGLQA